MPFCYLSDDRVNKANKARSTKKPEKYQFQKEKCQHTRQHTPTQIQVFHVDRKGVSQA